MKEKLSFGLNKTGMKAAPFLSKEMLLEHEELNREPEDSSKDAMDMREEYIKGSDDVGSVPLPMSPQGVISAGLQVLKGNDPKILIDQLGERLAFERSGVRLYDALLTKCMAFGETETVDVVRDFREEEARHFDLIRDAIEDLGGDSTAVTPGADVAGVLGMGIMQVLTDPRTTLPQCIEAILIAELADNDAWKVLIQLCEKVGMPELAEQFREAEINESKHLNFMRSWYEALIIRDESKAQAH
ncbi:ferritin-like domain-containing protein [Bdellovibrio reynosensis]|uniref:Ferritin-like domain-containing protein n=1 Tax=Bdellovibrio reynosensis TaxID=2835041 RepID=A0ABY4CFF9_9BACT|nr:ferritin-like domain-containing protein [Bdellovibrio reynosensis]UOF02278.1 ferritin-like domain-containing protein [Bdellovibrio reynosensis]